MEILASVNPDTIRKCEECVVAAGLAVGSITTIWRCVVIELIGFLVSCREERTKLHRFNRK